MTKKIIPLTDYITASEAATILTEKMGRPIKPGYIHKLQKVRFVKLDNTSKLYNKHDIETTTIKQKQ